MDLQSIAVAASTSNCSAHVSQRQKQIIIADFDSMMHTSDDVVAS